MQVTLRLPLANSASDTHPVLLTFDKQTDALLGGRVGELRAEATIASRVVADRTQEVDLTKVWVQRLHKVEL